jgi:hypothetical protein
VRSTRLRSRTGSRLRARYGFSSIDQAARSFSSIGRDASHRGLKVALSCVGLLSCAANGGPGNPIAVGWVFTNESSHRDQRLRRRGSSLDPAERRRRRDGITTGLSLLSFQFAAVRRSKRCGESLTAIRVAHADDGRRARQPCAGLPVSESSPPRVQPEPPPTRWPTIPGASPGQRTSDDEGSQPQPARRRRSTRQDG